MIVAQSKATVDLLTHLPHLSKLVQQAWEDVKKAPSEWQLIMCARTRASLMHDCMLARAAIYADQTSGVRLFERLGMHGIVVDGRYAIRFKMFDKDSNSKNQPTRQVAEFRAQAELEGIDAAHHLELGYVINELATEVVDVRMTCPSGRGNAWVLSIMGEVAETVIADIFSSAVDEIEAADVKPRRTSADVLPFKGKKNEG